MKQGHLTPFSRASPLPSSTQETENSIRLVSLFNDKEGSLQSRHHAKLKQITTKRTKSLQARNRHQRTGDSEDITTLRLTLLKETEDHKMPRLQDKYLTKVKPDYFMLKSQTDALAEQIDSKLRPTRLKKASHLRTQTLFDSFYEPPSKDIKLKMSLIEYRAQKAFFEFSLPISELPESQSFSFRGHPSKRTTSQVGKDGVLKGASSILRGVMKCVNMDAML